MYRKYRGESYPAYTAPPGIALLDKWRGERPWSTAIRVAPYAFNGMLTILGWGLPLYVALHECKIGRNHWIQGFRLQTTDPAVE